MHKNAIFSYKLSYYILLDNLTCILYSTDLQSDNIKNFMPDRKTLPIYIYIYILFGNVRVLNMCF